ncbi:21012_t:CDS:2, partial [Racocetra persica]
NQVTFAINEALYDNQTKFDIHNNVVYEIDHPENKTNDAINFEGANDKNMIDQKWCYLDVAQFSKSYLSDKLVTQHHIGL